MNDDVNKEKVTEEEDLNTESDSNSRESDSDEEDSSSREDGDDEGDEDEEEADEEDSDEQSDEDEEESSEESDGSEDSVWDEFEKADGQTQEAAEATILQKFQNGLQYIVQDKKDKARRTFSDLLQEPLVASQEKDSDDFNADDSQLSKMARVYIGIHKNLAILNPHKAIDHYVKVLAIAPNIHPEIWNDIAYKTLETGDLDFARFAFEKAGIEERMEAKAIVLYLSRQFQGCLEVIKQCHENGNFTDVMRFMKEKIKKINTHYKITVESLFNELGDYEIIETLPSKTFKELDEKMKNAVGKQEKLWAENIEKEHKYEPILIDIASEYSLQHVLTIFCDVFDRIESYSSFINQTIKFPSWDQRETFLCCNQVMEDMLDVLETVDMLASNAFISLTRPPSREEKLANLNIRRSTRKIENLDIESEDEDYCDLSLNKMAEEFSLRCNAVQSFRITSGGRSTRTPTPEECANLFHEERFLDIIRSLFINKELTIREIIETIMLQLAKFCPFEGVMPKTLRPVFIQIYRRLNLMRSNMEGKKWINLHLTMADLGDETAYDYILRFHYTYGWDSIDKSLRFAWNHVQRCTDETICLRFLQEMYDKLEQIDCEVITAAGSFSSDDVNVKIEAINKKNRIESVKELKQSGRFNELVRIIECDISFDKISDDDIMEMSKYWVEGLIQLKSYTKAVSLINRLFRFYPTSEAIMPKSDFHNLVVSWIHDIDLSQVDRPEVETLAFFVCSILNHAPASWPVWKCLYLLIRQLEGDFSTTYIQSLDAHANDEALPSKALDVLVKAHECLGEEKKCFKSDFLPFYISKLYDLVQNKEVMQLVVTKERSWIWANVNAEVAQLLQCCFGRFGKKRKQCEDHGSSSDIKMDAELAEKTIFLAMPHPLPLFDEKERLGHDVVDLIQSKFAKLIKISTERKEILEKFKEWLKNVRQDDIKEQESLNWPRENAESIHQSCIWYVLALHCYRQNNYVDTMTYAGLFITSQHATIARRETVSAWAMYAHSASCDVFQLSDECMLSQLGWRFMPYRVAIKVDETVGVLHFQHANCLYQVCTRLLRFINSLSSDDPRRRSLPLIAELREESREHFEGALSLGKPTDDNLLEEYYWLCYFFLAKLYAKAEDYDVVKVVDFIYESACSCQLGDYFYYPLKINVKKQQNVEPVELHYQVHSVVWKYLLRTENPPLPTLVSLLAYLRAFQRHKVVKNNLSLFSITPEVEEVLINLTFSTETRIRGEADEDVLEETNNMVTKVDIIDELWNLCYAGFELVCERFPHPKAFYRLAQMEYSRNNVQKSLDLMLKGVFRKKKKDENFFESVIEMTSSDIDRSGSFVFHFEKWLRMTISLLTKQKDLHNLMSIFNSLILIVANNEKDRLDVYHQKPMCSYLMKAISSIASTERLSVIRNDLVRIYTLLDKYRTNLFLRHIQGLLKNLVNKYLCSMEKLVQDRSFMMDQVTKRKPYRKRKLEVPTTSRFGSLPRTSLAAFMRPTTTSSLYAKALRLSQPDDDVQIVEDPMTLMKMALHAAGIS